MDSISQRNQNHIPTAASQRNQKPLQNHIPDNQVSMKKPKPSHVCPQFRSKHFQLVSRNQNQHKSHINRVRTTQKHHHNHQPVTPQLKKLQNTKSTSSIFKL